ncbi:MULTISPECIES: ABC transporter permease subunit [unclassified Streptomyces]|uniref:ABC transporter permease subunit n=1 Tax=unclassified Streptomyces TaxID=2593676 RepID=UPI002E795014|nr:ABC transporter permease subunit [Streptomyces sp. JV176]MEE1800454.1 ABC transporter permease subunit [Streptomyces sp. JV176]
MTTLTREPAHAAPAGPTRKHVMPRLGGTVWLVWRQHRAAFWTITAATLVGVAAMLYLRGQMMDFLGTQEPTARRSGGLSAEFETHVDRLLSIGSYLGYIPVLAGVLLGAPLIAGDLESGTAKLVTSQSVSRLRWLTTKLAVPAVMLALSTGVLTAVLTRWWGPVKGLSEGLNWTSLFSVTGVVPVAYALLTFTVGVAVGLLLRRTLVSMVVTLGIVVAMEFLWSEVWRSLGHVMSISTDQGVGPGQVPPELPAEAEQQGQGTYFLTGSGDRLDWMTCLDKIENDRAHAACLQSKDVIGWSIDYLPVTQMQTMQWLGAGLMLTITAAVVAFILTWGRKRLL